MEFLRFGSSIPGEYRGCCCFDIIQNFNQDPDDETSIQIIEGDQGFPMMNGNRELLFAGPTHRDVFWQRLRFGTFSNRDMPNHGFLAILTRHQVQSAIGGKWLAILKEAGFEFIRTVSNSVYGGEGMDTGGGEVAPNYLFGLFRNIGNGAIKDPFTPPKEWQALPTVVSEAWNCIGADHGSNLAKEQTVVQRAIWDKIGPAKLMTEKELVVAGAPVRMAGKRSQYPPQLVASRETLKKALSVAKPPRPSSSVTIR